MTLWIDPPRWAAHGHVWSHLVSDESLEELHAFAARTGIPARGFEGDHYDVPEVRYAAVVAAGARPTDAKDLVRRLRASGLRMQKRRGETGIARVRGVALPGGGTADVDLIASDRLAPEARVFGSMVFVHDARGDLAVVHAVSRRQWGAPGGHREAGESVWDTALREVREETGLELEAARLAPVGYERFAADRATAMVTAERDLLQAFRADLDAIRPALSSELDDTSERRWVTPEGFGELCGSEFWWPLAAHVLGIDGGGRRPERATPPGTR